MEKPVFTQEMRTSILNISQEIADLALTKFEDSTYI
jgi:hypothetical protein